MSENGRKLGLVKPGDVQIIVRTIYPKDGDGNPVPFCPVTPPVNINMDGISPGVIQRHQIFSPCSTQCKKNVDGECTL